MNKNSTALFNSHLTLAGYENARMLTIIQNDKTKLEFNLRDKNNDPIVLNESTGQAQIVDSDDNVLKAVFSVEVGGSTASFIIDKPLPVDEYELYIKVGDYYFPSKEQSFILNVIEAYDVVDIDIKDVQTIDIVVDALAEQITPLLTEQAEGIFRSIITENPEQFKGDKGDAFTIHDFTEEEFNNLRGSDGEPFVFENFTAEQLNDLRLTIVSSVIDEDGNTTVTFNDGSTLIIPKGAQGERGLDGDSVTFESLTSEQKSELTGHQGLSAYQLAVQEGFVGSEFEWLESLKGQDGEDGQDGQSFDYENLTPEQKAEIKGEQGDKGDSFEYEDFTQEQLDELRGETGQAFTYDMFTPEQLEALKGEQGEKGEDGDKGEAGVNGLHGNTTSVENNEDGSYDIVVTNPNSETEISRNTVRDGVDGTNGTDGIDGESLRYEDLTPEQIAEIQEGLPIRPPKIYTRAEYDALDSYDPHTLYFVVGEDEIPQ